MIWNKILWNYMYYRVWCNFFRTTLNLNCASAFIYCLFVKQFFFYNCILLITETHNRLLHRPACPLHPDERLYVWEHVRGCRASGETFCVSPTSVYQRWGLLSGQHQLQQRRRKGRDRPKVGRAITTGPQTFSKM